MQKSDRGFEQIMAAVLEQKQVWEKLQAENRELRQQLMDLRAGRGISIEIGNQRFELAWEPHRTDSSAGEAPAGRRPQALKNGKGPVQPPSAASSGVLEEMLLDEFSSAMGTHRAGSHEERKPSASFNEEQKATLRRELSGSFLLE